MFEADTLTNLESSFAGVAEELRRQYSIGYYPEAPGEPGERRSVKIRVSRPANAVVRAKNGSAEPACPVSSVSLAVSHSVYRVMGSLFRPVTLGNGLP